MVDTAVGIVKSEGGTEFISTARGEIGFALFGPYLDFEKGGYSVVFRMRIPAQERSACADQAVSCYVEVVAEAGARRFAHRPVLAATLKSDIGAVTLDFALEATENLEFRVYVTGNVPLIIETTRRVTARLDETAGAPQTPEDDPHRAFVAAHSDKFQALRDRGAVIRTTDNGTIIDFLGMTLNVDNFDDFQLINEVLVSSMYRFATSSEVCVCDIGMNVGLASLFFAQKHNVKAVHAFEPFKPPFHKALANFRLNPALAGKIRAHNYGLGAASQTLSIPYDDSHTIATSIKGTSAGPQTEIIIRDAAAVFPQIIDEARSSGLEVVVKLDCEGSEFPIIETLDNAGLLRYVRIFMIEWHKAWSPDKNQHDIIARLMRSGFDVIDQTNPFDPYAGQLYAMRVQSASDRAPGSRE